MRARVEALALGVLVVLAIGLAVLVPASAQSAVRLFATLSTNLTTGASTPLTCTASGAGCYLDVVVGGGTMTPNAICFDATNQDVCLGRAAAGALSITVGTSFRFPSGAVSTPSITFNAETDLGFYRSAANTLAFTSSGTAAGAVFSNGSGITIPSNLAFGFSSTTDATGGVDTQMLRGGAGVLSTAAFSATGSWRLGSGAGVIFASATAPSLAAGAGFCTNPTLSANNGTAAFTVTIGTGCGASVGTITMPAATTAWKCDFNNVTVPASNIPDQTGGTTTTVLVTNYARTTGLASNWTDSHVLRAACTAY